MARGYVFVCAASLVALLGAPALAQVTLNAAINVDNVFTAFISTSPTLAGTSIANGISWPTTTSGTYVFPGAGTYYLHVLATDQGPPAMFIGTFSLSNAAGSTFSNGGTSLLTNATDWVVSNTGFGMNETAPLDIAGNPGGAWGNLPGQAVGARFLWAPTFTPTVYFSTVITVVPAPAAAAALGLAGLAAARRRR
ncbi:hypothetical protein BH11PLA1_BH11PLA1_18140 [soil metagenome]